MKINFNSRLKSFLIELIIRENDENAWQHLQTLKPNVDDLYTIIKANKFTDEAWTLLEKLCPSKEDLLYFVHYTTKKVEASNLLLKALPLDNETLESIVEYTNNDDAARILLAQNPNQEALMTIVKHSTLKDEAAALALEGEVDEYDLESIIEHSSFKLQAWKKLLALAPKTAYYYYAIAYEDLTEIVWADFLNTKPSNEDLMEFVNDYRGFGKKRFEAAKIIFSQAADADVLTSIIDNNILVDEAFELLKKLNPNSDDLEWIIWRGNIKIDECADLSLKDKPNKKQLFEILYNSNRKKEAADLLVEMPLEIKELAELVLYANHKKAWNLLKEITGLQWDEKEEEALIKKLKTMLLENPDLLTVNHWHSEDKHCFGGWAIQITAAAQKVEKAFSPELAASLLLPNYTDLFFMDKASLSQALSLL